MKLKIENHYDVAPNKWRNWSDICKHVFNDTCGTMRENQGLYLHPKAAESVPELWRTTCFNAAWTAANACQRGTTVYLKSKKEQRHENTK